MMLADCLQSRYLLYHTLRDAGHDALEAARRVNLLLGPDDDDTGEFPALEPDMIDGPTDDDDYRPPYEEWVPDDADWAEYCQFLDRLDAMQSHVDTNEYVDAMSRGRGQ
jgi:hypothetical protein